MPQGNLSCMVSGPQRSKFENLPIPKIECPYEVLIRVSYVGVCGTDIHFWQDGKNGEDSPVTVGHEGSGIVQEVGSAVTNVAPGMHVAIEAGEPCRRCRQCKSGRYNLCKKMQPNCLLAKVVKVPEDFIYQLPDHVSLEEGALIEPTAVAVHSNKLAELKAGQTVLILGSGTVGLLTAMVSRAFGAGKVVLADINEKKLELAKSLIDCSTFVPDLDSTPEDNAERFKKESGLEDGAEVVMECTGVESSAQTSVYAARSGAAIVQIGMGKPLQALPLLTMCYKELAFKAAFRYSAGDFELALDMVAAGKVNVKALISNIVPFEKAAEAWNLTANGNGIKTLIQGVTD